MKNVLHSSFETSKLIVTPSNYFIHVIKFGFIWLQCLNTVNDSVTQYDPKEAETVIF